MAYLNMRHMRRITGATARQLDYWESKGLLTPSGTVIEGRGWRGYTIDDAILARTIKMLREEGTSLRKIEQVLEVLLKSEPSAAKRGEHLQSLKLVAYGGDVYVKTTTGEAYRAVDGQATFLFIDMEQIGQQVERELSKLGIAVS